MHRPGACGVTIPAENTSSRKQAFHRHFDPFGADSKMTNAGALAVWTNDRNRLLVAAIVAQHYVVSGMKGHRDIAMPAAGHVTTLSAYHTGGTASSIEEQNRLFSPVKRLLQRQAKRHRDYAGITAAKFGAQIYDLHWGKACGSSRR